MSVACRYFSHCIVALLIVSNYESALAAESGGQKAIVVGTPTANLRTGAGVEHALKLTLKEGDSVTIEKLEGEWFWVTTPDGQQGYIHKNLLKPVDRVVAQEPVAAQTAGSAGSRSCSNRSRAHNKGGENASANGRTRRDERQRNRHGWQSPILAANARRPGIGSEDWLTGRGRCLRVWLVLWRSLLHQA
jgi:hypothetical protein